MTATYSVIEAMRRAAAQAYRLDEKLTVSQWADKYRQLAASSAAEPGPWRTDRAPYLREIMDSADTPGVNRVTFIKASQLGGTEALYNGLLYVIDTSPGFTLFAYPNTTLAETSNKLRVHPAVRACDRLARKLSGSPRDLKALRLEFSDHTVDFVGGHSDANMQSRPCRRVFLDELDRFASPGGAIEQARSRTKTFGDKWLVFAVSTPTLAEHGIHAEYLKGDQRRYLTPCPHCSVCQEWLFPNLKWEGGSDALPDNVRKTAWIECESCGKKIDDRHKPNALRLGIWAPAGQDAMLIDGVPTLVGDADRPNSSHRSYKINSLYSPFLTFGDVVAEFLSLGATVTPKFVQEFLGEPWVQAGDRVESGELADLIVAEKDGGHANGTLHDQVDALVTTIDVQKDSVWVLVMGYGLGGRLEAQIDAFRLPAEPGNDLRELDDLPARVYVSPRSGRQLQVSLTGIDHGYRSAEVERFRERMLAKGLRVVCVKGDGSPGAPGFKVAEVTQFRGKHARLTALPIVHIGNNRWRDHLSGIVAHSRRVTEEARRGEAGVVSEETLERDGAIRLVLADNCPRSLLDQWTSEHRTSGTHRGLPVQKWMLRPGRSDNHLLDCYAYNRALASAEGFDRVRETAPQRKRLTGRVEL